MRLLRLLTLASLLATCGRTPLDLAPIQTGGSPGASDADPNRTGGGPSAGDAGDGACFATCSTPPGPIRLYPTDAEATAGLIGVWRICYGGHDIFIEAPSDTIGVEFTPPTTSGSTDIEGNMYFLRKGASGPVRGGSPEYRQTYLVSDGVLYCHTKDGGYAVGLKYSPCPREWWFENDATSHSGTLASF